MSKFSNNLPPPDLTHYISKVGNQYCAGGAFGDVYKCHYTDGQAEKEVAVKAIRFKLSIDGHTPNDDKHARMLRRELGIWKRLDHINIVPFLGIAYGFGMEGTMSLVSLWMPHNSLHAILERHNDDLGLAHRLQFLLDISSGLHYLHSLPVVHGDLKCDNVLLDADYTARLADFGFASLMGNIPEALSYLHASTTRGGALRWCAPEQVEPAGSSDRTTKSDVLSGKLPWSECKGDGAIVLSLLTGQKPGRPDSRPMDDLHWKFIEGCWSVVEERPTTEAIISTIRLFLSNSPPSLSLRDMLIPPSSSLVEASGEGSNETNNVLDEDKGGEQGMGKAIRTERTEQSVPGQATTSSHETEAHPSHATTAFEWTSTADQADFSVDTRYGPPLEYVVPEMHTMTVLPLLPDTSPYSMYTRDFPWQYPTQVPKLIKTPRYPENPGDIVRFQRTNVDPMDPFAKRAHHGPDPEPSWAEAVEFNPLLAPPADNPDDYLRWNMLFHSNKCYRTTERQGPWIKGRDEPATHPRLTHIQIITRAFPWMIHARAQNPLLGVTCGEVVDAISTCMYDDVEEKEHESQNAGQRREIWENYQFNRSTDSNVPGVRLGSFLKRLDWLGSTPWFGGLVSNDAFVKKRCGDLLPYTFELKRLSSCPLTAEELRERQRRLENLPRQPSAGSSRQLSS